MPPTYTKWNHRQTIAYFQSDEAGRRLEDVLALGEPDMYSAGNPVQATTTTLKELQVFPQPVQKPHPQLWEPLTSARSLKFAAEHGINGVMIAEPNDRLRRNIEIYYEAAEKAGFPDMLNRGRFKFGWDAEKRRGIMTSRYLHITRPGKEKEALDRAARAIELQFDYYGPFGFGAVVARLDEPMFDLNKRVTAEMLREREIAIHGSKQYVIDTIMKMRERVRLRGFLLPRLVRAWRFRGQGDRGADADLRRGGHAGHRPRMRRQGRVAGARSRFRRVTARQANRSLARRSDGKQRERGAEQALPRLGGGAGGEPGDAARRIAAPVRAVGRGSPASRAASITSKPTPAGFRRYGRCRRGAPKTACCCARMAAVTWSARCTRTAKFTLMSPRQ